VCRYDESDADHSLLEKAAAPRPTSAISVICKADRPCENESPIHATISERRPATDEIYGLIERVTFHNDDSGFSSEIGKTLATTSDSVTGQG